jgi:hypothetical protein
LSVLSELTQEFDEGGLRPEVRVTGFSLVRHEIRVLLVRKVGTRRLCAKWIAEENWTWEDTDRR